MEIYCGSVTEPETGLCAWSYFIKYKNKKYSLTSHRVLQSETSEGETIALVKAFGYIKNFQVKRVSVYCGSQSMIKICSGIADPKRRKTVMKELSGADKGLYCCMEPYFSRYTITMHKISNAENPAYEIALEEFQKTQSAQSPEEQSPEEQSPEGECIYLGAD